MNSDDRQVYGPNGNTKPKATELSHVGTGWSLVPSQTVGLSVAAERAVCVSRGLVAGLAHMTRNQATTTEGTYE